MDLRKPGEEEDEYSEMAEEAMDPDNCFPDGKHVHTVEMLRFGIIINICSQTKFIKLNNHFFTKKEADTTALQFSLCPLSSMAWG